jgi:LPXTG-site transpeptidase (sortase) family protein
MRPYAPATSQQPAKPIPEGSYQTANVEAPRRQQASIEPAPHKKTKRVLRSKLASPFILYAMAGMLFIAGGYVVFSSLRTNDHVKAQVQQLQSAADSNGDAGDAPTNEKPTPAAVNGYTVAPLLARYLDIPKLGVHARVRPLGIKNDNTLKAPTNGYDVGWYDASSRPGENGAMLIDGHSNVLGKSAVFAHLGKLAAGDVIKVTRGDSVVLTYTVRTVQTVDDDKVDMGSLLVSADTAKPGLNLITCAGDVIPGTLHLDKRTLVRAVLE